MCVRILASVNRHSRGLFFTQLYIMWPACLVVPYFTILITVLYSGKKCNSMQWVQILSRTFTLNTSHTANSARYYHECVEFVIHISTRFSRQILTNQFFNISKNPRISYFMKNPSSDSKEQSCYTRPEGRTKPSRFSQLCEPHNTEYYLHYMGLKHVNHYMGLKHVNDSWRPCQRQNGPQVPAVTR